MLISCGPARLGCAEAFSSEMIVIRYHRCLSCGSAQAGAWWGLEKGRQETVQREPRVSGASAAGCKQLIISACRKKETGWGKRGILPVEYSRRQWCNQLEGRGFRAKTLQLKLLGGFLPPPPNLGFLEMTNANAFNSLHIFEWMSEWGKGTGLKIYKLQSRMWWRK